MKRTAVLIVLAAAAAAGVLYYRSVNASAVAAPRIVQQSVTIGDIVEAVQATGTLGPTQTVNVGSQVSGVVSNLYADFNDVVKRGQVIATLDPSLLQVQVDLQDANLQRQMGEIANQQTQLENDRKTLERQQALFERGLVNRESLDDATVAVKVRESQVAAAQKTLRTFQANLDQAKLNLSYTTIKSPIDGVVVNRLVDVGQTVQSSLNVAQFFTLATDLRSLRLQATVDEADIGRIRPGMPVDFTVDAYGTESFRGTVDTVNLNATSTNNVVTFPVWIDVKNPQLKLRPSMTANVRIVVDSAAEAIRIPNTAYRFRPTADVYRALGLTPPSASAAASPATSPASASEADAKKSAAAARELTPLRALIPKAGDKVDELFAPISRPVTSATVWTWDAATMKLTPIAVELGTTDGQFSELVGGELQPGQQLLTSVVLPQTPTTPTGQSNIFNNMNGRGAGGFGGPGGFGPGGGR